MSADDPAPRIEQVHQTIRTAPTLLTVCQDAAESDGDGEVVVAVREFPASEYTFLFNKHEIAIVKSKLIMRGYAVDTKTVMDSKCSRLILVVENNTTRQMAVRAEKLK